MDLWFMLHPNTRSAHLYGAGGTWAMAKPFFFGASCKMCCTRSVCVGLGRSGSVVRMTGSSTSNLRCHSA
jgi:hypothetical protein